MEVYAKGRYGKYKAIADYDPKTNKTIVKKGSTIQLDFADHIEGGVFALKYRNNPDYVEKNGVVLQDCMFRSPSTAAQFVTGRSTNGYIVWHDKNGKSLKYLKDKKLI